MACFLSTLYEISRQQISSPVFMRTSGKNENSQLSRGNYFRKFLRQRFSLEERRCTRGRDRNPVYRQRAAERTQQHFSPIHRSLLLRSRDDFSAKKSKVRISMERLFEDSKAFLYGSKAFLREPEQLC